MKEKRPPINISEMEVKEEGEKPGEISYVRSEKVVKGEVKVGGADSRGTLFGIDSKSLIVILVALILSVIVIVSYAPSKASVMKEVSRFETVVAEEIKGIKANSQGSEQQRIENLIQTVDKLTQRIKVLEAR